MSTSFTRLFWKMHTVPKNSSRSCKAVIFPKGHLSGGTLWRSHPRSGHFVTLRGVSVRDHPFGTDASPDLISNRAENKYEISRKFPSDSAACCGLERSFWISPFCCLREGWRLQDSGWGNHCSQNDSAENEIKALNRPKTIEMAYRKRIPQLLEF